MKEDRGWDGVIKAEKMLKVENVSKKKSQEFEQISRFKNKTKTLKLHYVANSKTKATQKKREKYAPKIYFFYQPSSLISP